MGWSHELRHVETIYTILDFSLWDNEYKAAISSLGSLRAMASVNGNRTVPVFQAEEEDILEFGGHLKELFPFGKNWLNLNHGTFVPATSRIYPWLTIGRIVW